MKKLLLTLSLSILVGCSTNSLPLNNYEFSYNYEEFYLQHQSQIDYDLSVEGLVLYEDSLNDEKVQFLTNSFLFWENNSIQTCYSLSEIDIDLNFVIENWPRIIYN